jgi:PTH1 family peptidyl-tRNA hydrolase
VLIVGLGNPGPEYLDTRHNIGFRCVDELAHRCKAPWYDATSRVRSLVAVGHFTDHTIVLAKPQTYMNRSGEAVDSLLARLHLTPEQCLVIYDDMDLPLTTIRMRERGSPGTHNGMRSVVATTGTTAIPRLRVGISQSLPGNATNHVLSEFDPSERDAVQALIGRAADAALAWAIEGPAVAMNRYNSSSASSAPA